MMRAARKQKDVKVVELVRKAADSPEDVTSPPVLPETREPRSAALPWVKPRGFAQVPTHVVGVAHEQRAYPRAALHLPLRLRRVAGQLEPVSLTLVTKNISSCGVYFLCPRPIEPGTPVELEVALIERPLGRGSVRMTTAAHIVRAEPSDTPGWHGLAATFDDITFQRDEHVPA